VERRGQHRPGISRVEHSEGVAVASGEAAAEVVGGTVDVDRPVLTVCGRPGPMLVLRAGTRSGGQHATSVQPTRPGVLSSSYSIAVVIVSTRDLSGVSSGTAHSNLGELANFRWSVAVRAH